MIGDALELRLFLGCGVGGKFCLDLLSLASFLTLNFGVFGSIPRVEDLTIQKALVLMFGP